MKTILLHSEILTEKEFIQIGKSKLHVKTEEFYKSYGIDKAIKYYMNIKEELRMQYGKHIAECEAFSDCVCMIDKLLVLKNFV